MTWVSQRRLGARAWAGGSPKKLLHHREANIETAITITSFQRYDQTSRRACYKHRLIRRTLSRPVHTSAMASTVPSQQISTTSILLAAAGTLTLGGLAYAIYFDHKRRSDPQFRKSLKKQHKKVSKASAEEAKAGERAQKDKIKRVVEEANEEGFPRDPEETEGYFMQEVARGEGMCQDGSDPVDAALCFYKALKVYPQPRELISIYDKTVPKVRWEIMFLEYAR